MTRLSFIVAPEEEGLRIDKLLAIKLQNSSRTGIQKLIEEGQVLVAGGPVKPSSKVRAGATVEARLPRAAATEVMPEILPLDIIYEDQDLLVVNKPSGMVVHPAAGNFSGTLVNGLLYHCRDLSTINGPLRPGIVHRLDKDTSGALMVAKNDTTHLALAGQLKRQAVTRLYWAVVHGRIEEEGGRIEAPIGRHPVNRKRMAVLDQGGKPALTEYRVQERFADYTLLTVRLHTGRTHQIRVHCAYLAHPIMGDPLYGSRINPFGMATQALHAQRLGFVHPGLDRYMEFTAPLPPVLIRLWDQLRLSAID